MGQESSSQRHSRAGLPSSTFDGAHSGRINRRLLTSSYNSRTPMEITEHFSGFHEVPLLSLEQACRGLRIDYLSENIERAKRMAKYRRHGLTIDEQAAIHLYTQETPLYHLLNDALRRLDGRAIIPWHPYLKLFVAALQKLPLYRGTVWRGVPRDLSAKYEEGDVQTWWAFSSCTSSLEVLKSPNFLGATGVRTLFNIEIFDGRQISEFSDHSSEGEIILLPGTCVRVVGQMKQSDGLQIVQLKQIRAPNFLFDKPTQTKQERNTRPKDNRQRRKSGDNLLNDEYTTEYYRAKSSSAIKPPATFYTQLELAHSVSSDTEKANLLKHLLSIKHQSDQMISDIAECIKTLYSDSEKHALLLLILKRSELSEKQLLTVVALINEISSDNCKQSALLKMLSRGQFIARNLHVIIAASEKMHSDNARYNVYLGLMDNQHLNVKHYQALLPAIENISSDSYKAALLCKLAPKLPKDNIQISRAYIKAVNSIHSSREKVTATLAFQ